MHHFIIRMIVLGVIIFLLIHYNVWDHVSGDFHSAYVKFLRDLHTQSMFIRH